MNINLRYIIIALAALLGITTSCTDESTDIPAVKTEGLTLMVPDAVRFASRAAGDNGEAELTYSSLYFFAFPQGSGELLITPLATGNGSPGFVKDGYRTYPLTLKNGTYRFFLVANYFDASSALPQDEDALKKKLLSFDENFNFMIPVMEDGKLKGIPMSADAGDFSFRDASGAKKSVSLFEYTGQAGSLIADLTFCYAKVTIIPQNASGDPIAVSDLNVSNYSEQEPVISAGNSYNSYGTVDHSKAEFDPVTTVDGGKISAYTFYVPERYITAAGDDTEATVMTMTIDDKEVSITLGQTALMEPNGSYIVPEADELPFIRRGYHYVYTLTTTDKINVVVEPWTPKVLANKLNGPVYLHIEKDEYEITAGEETKIWFDSSVGNDLTIESPTYTVGSVTYDLYQYSVNATADTLTVWVNDAIPSAEYPAIKKSITDGEGKYDYFHIVAGNIMKRVNVSPLSLDYYLRLNPENIALDVKLRVASGEYQGDLPVSIRSNYPQVKVYLVDGWSDIPSDSGDALKVISPENAEVTAAGVISPMTGGRIQYFVDFKGMNSGWKIWKENRTLTFEVAGLDENGDPQVSIPVTINIIPSILNYKIHFKAQNGDWNLPHIYVYQCLEFPANYNGTYLGTPLANKPIGYESGDARFAALEYSFSGAISFRGWDFPANNSLLYNDNGTQKAFAGKFDRGFYIFNEQNETWDAQNVPDKAEVRYNFYYDFCSVHRAEVSNGTFDDHKCPYCAWLYNKDGNKMNRLWPGIMMKKEDTNDGWYEFDLTGIAEPGKALIMFADTHAGSDRRFPGGDQVGVPLFDYPSHEGWFLFNGDQGDRVNNNFSSTKPGSVVVTTNGYRIYWPTSLNRKKVHIWIEGSSAITTYDKDLTSNYTGTTSNGGYYYYDFNANVGSASKFGIIFYNDDNDKYPWPNGITIPVTTFTTDVNVGRKCAYMDNGNMVSGTPESHVSEPKKYRVYWPETQNNSNQVCLWIEKGNNDEGITDWDGGQYQGTTNGYRYYQFDASPESNQDFGYIFHSGNDRFNNADAYVAVSTFTEQSDGVYCAYFDGSSWNTGEPPVQVVTSNTYRIYWPSSQSNSDQLCLWIENGNSDIGIIDWNGGQPQGTTNGYHYYQFNASPASNQDFGYIFHSGDAKFNNDAFVAVSKFIDDGTGVKCAYFLAGTWYSGIPTNEYRIYWQKSYNGTNYTNIHVWLTPGGDITDWPGDHSGESGNYYYLNFESDDPYASIGYLFTNNGLKVTGDLGGKLTTFTPETVDNQKKNCAYYNGSNLVSGKP